MAKYKDFFVDLMMTEELSLPVPGDSDNLESLKDGCTMFVAFAAFGMLPIIGFVAAGALVSVLLLSLGLTPMSVAMQVL